MLTLDYLNAPLTPEEIAEEKSFGTPPEQIEAMVRAARQSKYQLNAERRAQDRANRQRAESAAAERLRAERKNRARRSARSARAVNSPGAGVQDAVTTGSGYGAPDSPAGAPLRERETHADQRFEVQ